MVLLVVVPMVVPMVVLVVLVVLDVSAECGFICAIETLSNAGSRSAPLAATGGGRRRKTLGSYNAFTCFT